MQKKHKYGTFFKYLLVNVHVYNVPADVCRTERFETFYSWDVPKRFMQCVGTHSSTAVSAVRFILRVLAEFNVFGNK